ncbi:nucleotidyltransferase family protein [Methylophaga sp.]|uniref:nucleotidyltransferase family protein n=1 Tax=Methylophaga sp. TaxID=2024840 RepID=UPI0013FE79EA|nr:nucleotidyltransferase family protein [Methylophaga sp.]MTI64801.1 nucleotidyltransferase family protein [Methylophaga sp.]
MSGRIIRPVVLAAGQSSRFGSDKLLHPIAIQGERKPLIFHSLYPWLTIFSNVDVVIREDNLTLLHLLENCEFSSRLRLIPAENARQGMSASFIAGIQANIEADGWLIGLADMPYINSLVIADSLAALEAGAAITLPEFSGRRGHPVGLVADLLPQLMALKGDKGARDIIRASARPICFISSVDEGIFRDVDTREDLLPQSG